MKASPIVLLVDDEAIVAKDLEFSLRRFGYTVSGTASTGAEAISQTESQRPDVVLMDIRLKGDMDGVDAARQIRTRHDVPIIYLTAYADDTTLARAGETSPYGYLVKPYQEKELHATIETALHRHQIERQIKREERRCRALIEAIPQLVFIADSSGQASFFNRRWFDYTGLPTEESQGEGWLDAVHAYDLARVREVWSQSVRTGSPLELECGLRSADGQYRWHLIRAVTGEDTDGTIRWFATCTDIEEERRREAALRRSEAHKRAIIESSLDCIITVDHDGKITDFNSAAEHTFGLSRTEVLGRHVGDTIIPSRLREPTMGELAQFVGSASSTVRWHRTELTVTNANGTEFPAELCIVQAPVVGRPVYTWFLRDITDRRRAEALREEFIRQLREAVVRGRKSDWMLPVCASCRRVRDDKDDWMDLNEFLRVNEEKLFTHGLCPSCANELYPGLLQSPIAE